MLDMPNITQPYLVEGLLYERGKTVLVGKPKSGKSWLALKIGLSVASGEPLLGLKVTQAPVLVLEFDRRFLLSAVHEIAQGKRADNMEILPANPTPLNDMEGFRLLMHAVHACYPKSNGQLLVIIDHKSACFTGKENEDVPNRKWIETLDRVNSAFPVVFLVLCQAPKGWKGEIVDLPFRSRILTAWADTVISIQRPNKDTRKFEMISNYGEIEPITYTKDFRVVMQDSGEESKLENAKTLIMEKWDEFKYPNISDKVEEIAEQLGCSYSTVWTAYSEAKKLKRTQGTMILSDSSKTDALGENETE
jgi:hypothetical protein